MTRPESTRSARVGGGHAQGGDDLRCACGSLLARRKGDRLELKCRRCKRVVGIAVLISTGGGCGCT